MLSIFVASLCGTVSVSWAHGEDKPGPNGGMIRMPGAFHTEVLLENGKQFRVYLLDINFGAATVEKSSVQAEVRDEKKISKLTCSAEKNSFVCSLPNGLKPKGELIVKATRMGAPGIDAVYELPLKFKEQKDQPRNQMSAPSGAMDHESHSHH
jgi:hypothetical protein